ncbi:MAG: DUF1743 domain-containing protein [Candidatus Heimdallarchaeota archaeon]|nr:MAG: DUF1743 domain-containing protein [Candidatus Heimdallarchaeota archaeon]
MQETWHIGIDDTDSESGMCTTYLATLLVDLLLTFPVEFLDFPNLIRLNPNIPFKTRGNGAISISFIASEEIVEDIWKKTVELVKLNADINDPKTDPGLIIIKGEVPFAFQEIYQQAIYTVIPLKRVKTLLEKHPNKHFSIKDGRGLIGATAAIGADLLSDYTYEFIAYRDLNQRKSERLIDPKSVLIADKKIPLTFNNYDYEHKKVMITPHGPDPVFCGIRGETSSAVIRMWELIKILEPIRTVMIFRTNQHTQVHFPKKYVGQDLLPHLSVKVRGIVVKKPKDFPGGHVIFTIKSGNTSVDCAAYEPTKHFRKIVRELIEGDEVLVFGGVRPASAKNPVTINLEEIKIIRLISLKERITPKCPICEASLTSAGKDQGLKCKKCSYKSPEKLYYFQQRSRKIRTGVRYVIPVCAQRHLTKPVSRNIPLQFHLSSETDFQQAFYAFLKRRSELNSHPVTSKNILAKNDQSNL